MAVKWQAVCSFCGKGGTCTTRSDEKRPSNTPSMSGTCPSSPNKKHRPMWQRL